MEDVFTLDVGSTGRYSTNVQIWKASFERELALLSTYTQFCNQVFGNTVQYFQNTSLSTYLLGTYIPTYIQCIL